MADNNEITKFQLLAAIIGQDRAYRELEGAEAFGDVLIEILRRLHHWNDDKWDATTVIDVVFDAIAEEFRYAIGEWDGHGNDIDSSAPEPKHGNVLDAIEDTVRIARANGSDMPPQLDILNQH